MTGHLPGRPIVRNGDVFFTASPGATAELPLPFRIAGRLPLLVEAPRPRVAVLGFGLGAVAALMLAARPGARLVGVEPDEDLLAAIPESLRSRVALEHLDALSFLRVTRRRFDLVFDDCFVLAGSDAIRPPELACHAEPVARTLSPGGIYVRNLLPHSGRPVSDQTADLRRRFPTVALRVFRDWENVFALARDRSLPSGWRRRLRATS
ncbi:MAG TPA: class I SAM-dependent methyltransferase [Thermoanaerobaculia bacterium]|nr:class I SAM-dependent methyltransferase [Thermoanaerobaculia bacterium]